ncbi:MAG TPA: metallophosphoesterase [Polyangia bacterium]|nr:metallophosphoesterase [Polyangia bacterium]
MIETLAHLSDLHLGRSPEHDAVVAQLVDSLAGIDHVVVSGDITDRGKQHEFDRFERLFAPILAAGRLSVIPGNHDRLGDDMGARLRKGARVQTTDTGGVFVVRVDSTGDHNRFLLAGHSELDDEVIDEVVAAVDRAPARRVVIVTLHHHPLPQPEETFSELLATRVGLPYATELRLGHTLLNELRGRCDLVLHGHRHRPRATTLWPNEARPLGLYNAGCSPALGRFRVFAHTGGRLLGAPGWLDAREQSPLMRNRERRLTGTEARS